MNLLNQEKNVLFSLSLGERLLFTFLLILSFFTYGAVFYPELNADHAIHVLMAQDFSSYKDLYYWGQNRLGSLIPLLAHPLSFFLHPLWAVSIVQYMLVIGVAFWILYWVQNPLWRIALMLVWLFPSFHWACQILIAHSYSGQFFFLLTSFSFLHPRLAKPYLSILSLWLAFWCSELSVAALPAWIFLYFNYLNYKKIPLFSKQSIKLTSILFFIFLVGIILLLIVKNQLPDDKEYLSKTLVDDFKMLSENFNRALAHYSKTFGHNAQMPWINPLRWASLLWPISFVAITGLALTNIHKKPWNMAHIWASFLWITMGILLISRYFHIMGSSNHYLSLAPIISLFVLALYEGTWYLNVKKYLVFILLPIVLGLSVHNVYFFKRLAPYHDKYRINRETVEDFPIGNEPLGLVGTYWNSYIFGAFYPDKVAPTPYWGDYIRNGKLYEKAMDGRPVIVLGKGWMQPMQDSIFMGKYYLIRSSEIKVHKDTEFAYYQSIKIQNE